MYQKNEPTVIRRVGGGPWDQKNIEPGPSCHYSSAALIQVVNGQERFIDGIRTFYRPNKKKKGQFRCVSLNGYPLVQMSGKEGSGCFTYGLVAPGIGLERIRITELDQLQKNFKGGQPYGGFDDAVDKLKPFLSLLPSGYYVVADTLLCPTDGGKRFFWDIDAKPRKAHAFCRRLDKPSVGRVSSAHPQYLYPSERPSCFSDEKCDEAARYRYPEESPRAVAYALSQRMCLLIKGHHNAADHAYNSELVPTLVIIPHQVNTVRIDGIPVMCFADFSFPVGSMDSQPIYSETAQDTFEIYNITKGPFHTLRNCWQKYPPAEVVEFEEMSCLSNNAARILRCDGKPLYQKEGE